MDIPILFIEVYILDLLCLGYYEYWFRGLEKWLIRELSGPLENLGSITSIHMEAYNHL